MYPRCEHSSAEKNKAGQRQKNGMEIGSHDDDRSKKSCGD